MPHGVQGTVMLLQTEFAINIEYQLKQRHMTLKL